jgi:hypothetical protein
MARAYFVVRAVVADATDRPAFDRWYGDEHLPDAVRAFGARRAWRGWSTADPSVHTAFYEFPSVAAAQAIGGSEAIKGLIAEFDRAWGGRVTRTRDIVEVASDTEGPS